MIQVIFSFAFGAIVALLRGVNKHVADVTAELGPIILPHGESYLMSRAIVGLIDLEEAETMGKVLGVASFPSVKVPLLLGKGVNSGLEPLVLL